MKFGKRLAAEAARRWRPFFIDYKACKHAIQRDVTNRDPTGREFEELLRCELQKVAAFYADKEEELQATLAGLPPRGSATALESLRCDVHDLKKYAALNYVAVIKAIKKRNRRLAEACGESATALRAVQVLSSCYFFTTPRLAALATQAEVLASQAAAADGGAPAPLQQEQLRQRYLCPICLCVLHTPVVLTCDHRFCWGCLLAYCASAAERGSAAAQGAAVDKGEKRGAFASQMLAAGDDPPRVATYDCPVCRKAQILDIDNLQVDPHLHKYIEELRLRTDEEAAAPPPYSTSATAATAAPPRTSTAAAGCAGPPPTRPLAAIAELSDETESQATSSGTADGPHAPNAAARRDCGADLAGVVSSVCRASAAGLPPLAATAAAPAATAVAAAEAAAAPTPRDAGGAPLLPPQAAGVRGRLTVVLDLDGTLVSSYTPRRAPVLPAGAIGYLVGKGGKLNPQGVFVLERPGLREFFERVKPLAEIVLFTAGLEDYARPIADALDARYNCFAARLYRPATVACDVYPCCKDLSRLGRDLDRCVLVDDTPLAFFRQPDNGIPVYGFRSDPDDRILLEAVAPLLEVLAKADDVRPLLARRFNMPRWFEMQGLRTSGGGAEPPTPRPRCPTKSASDTALVQPAPSPLAPAAARRAGEPSEVLLVADFDCTVTDCDAGERLVGELAPELAPMLASLQMPANFVPLTNSVLAEMQRRGVSRDRLVGALRAMGSEVPPASLAMLRWAAGNGIDVRVLSDCNSVFIAHILTGAGVAPYVREVITNHASFERVVGPAADLDAPQPPGGVAGGRSWLSGSFTAAGGQGSTHRLVIHPRHPYKISSHGCSLCPANLCKGAELRKLRKVHGYGRVVYAGDGANDLCPALELQPGDLLLPRKGFSLDKLVAQRAAGNGPDARKVVARVEPWEDHAHLLALVRELARPATGSA